jgi:hypothetical protein
LEVAEHLPIQSAGGFVAELTALAPFILFSAAIPGQGGTNHLNEQWPEYWATRFAGHGYRVLDCIRPRIWEDDRIDFWYRQNIFLFVDSDQLPRVNIRHVDWPLARAHPGLIAAQPKATIRGAASQLFKLCRRELVRRIRF